VVSLPPKSNKEAQFINKTVVHNDVSSDAFFVPWSGLEKGNKVGGKRCHNGFLLPLPCLGHTLLKMVPWIQDGYTGASGREIGKF
jgi:hypothetical protein